MNTLRNMPIDHAERMAGMIEVRPHQVVSMGLAKSEHVQMTLFAFAKGESVSEEAYFGDTLYYNLEGTIWIDMDGKSIELVPGEVLRVPEGVLHAVRGKDDFKMLQITVAD